MQSLHSSKALKPPRCTQHSLSHPQPSTSPFDAKLFRTQFASLVERRSKGLPADYLRQVHPLIVFRPIGRALHDSRCRALIRYIWTRDIGYLYVCGYSFEIRADFGLVCRVRISVLLSRADNIFSVSLLSPVLPDLMTRDSRDGYEDR